MDNDRLNELLNYMAEQNKQLAEIRIEMNQKFDKLIELLSLPA